jgi:hypothetical protein
MGFVSWWKGEPPPEQGLFDSFLDMPFILKMVTISALTILFQLFIFLNPNASIAVDGESVPYSYLWKSGLV